MKAYLTSLIVLLTSLCCAAPCVNGQGPVSSDQATDIIVDSRLPPDEAIGNQKMPDYIRKQLRVVDVRYYSFDGRLHQGQLVINQALLDDVVQIFRDLERIRFPIARVIPISRYGNSDEDSMQDNNTSAFNYRPVDGTKTLSYHAYGQAIDINPLFNSLIGRGTVRPKGAKYDSRVSGTITKHSAVVKMFSHRGWKWGGLWKTIKDYQHFEKRHLH